MRSGTTLGITLRLPVPENRGTRPHKLAFRVYDDERDAITQAATRAGFRETGEFLRALALGAAAADGAEELPKAA